MLRFADNPYGRLGFALILAGAATGAVSSLVLRSVPLVALGISLGILGALSLALGRARPRVPPAAAAALLEAGLENISILLEELGLRSKAIYLPSALTGGGHYGLIPLRSANSVAHIQGPLPRRLIVKYGPGEADMGLLVAVPGAAAADLGGLSPGPTPGELETALNAVLAGSLDLADGVRVSMDGNRVTVTAFHPRIEMKNLWLYECLGSPLASVVAATVAEGLGKPVMVRQETEAPGGRVVELEIPQ